MKKTIATIILLIFSIPSYILILCTATYTVLLRSIIEPCIDKFNVDSVYKWFERTDHFFGYLWDKVYK